uniref:Uncharacterized protein n=1 Tax=Magallana gigas TaxID=29159 RepID=A0A8W8MKZ6_MAGGI
MCSFDSTESRSQQKMSTTTLIVETTAISFNTIPHRSTSTSITIDSERTRVLIQPLVTTLLHTRAFTPSKTTNINLFPVRFRDQYSIDGAGPPPPARVGSKEVHQTLHPSEEEGIGNHSKRTLTVPPPRAGA